MFMFESAEKMILFLYLRTELCKKQKLPKNNKLI